MLPRVYKRTSSTRRSGPHSDNQRALQATKAQAEEDEVPVWARREAERERQKQDGSDLPFGVYLLASAIVAIAAVSHPSPTGKHA